MPFIDWSPFFHTWELRGRYPGIFDDPYVGKQARELYDDAQKLLAEIVVKEAAAGEGGVRVLPGQRGRRRHRALTPTTAARRSSRRSTTCASSRTSRRGSTISRSPISSRRSESGRADYLGAFAVTTGHGTDELVARFPGRARRLQQDHDAGAGRPAGGGVRGVAAPAGAAATGVSARRRQPDATRISSRRNTAASAPRRAIPRAPTTRRSPGCSACSARRKQPGIMLTESNAMHPASSVSGWYFGASGGKVFRRRQAGARPGRRLRRAQRDAAPAGGTLARAVSELHTVIRARAEFPTCRAGAPPAAAVDVVTPAHRPVHLTRGRRASACNQAIPQALGQSTDSTDYAGSA